MEQPKFICDMMLGKLAKWLRIAGYDTLYFEKIEDSRLIRIAREENRILLTKDTLLARAREIRNRKVRALLIKSDYVKKQLAEVGSALKICPKNPRCNVCNVELESVEKTDVELLVPSYVYQTQSSFTRCPNCKRIYWKATHWERISEFIDRLKAE